MNAKLSRFLEYARAALRSLSQPPRFVAFALIVAFLLSLLSWALGDALTSYALFFPRREGSGLGAEKRELPRRRGLQAKAELLASELLLGPLEPALLPAFPSGVRVSAVLLRRGKLFLDLSEDAALTGRAELERGMAALRRTLALGLRGPRDFVITVGGREPYAEGLMEGPGPGGKKEQNN